jgi:hypothetical protein
MAIKISGTTVIDDSRNISSVGITTVGSGNSIITINGNTGIINVGTGITVDAINGNLNISGVLTVAQLITPISITSFTPGAGTTTIGISSGFSMTFNQTVAFGTTGFIEIKTGLNTTGGNLIERIGIGTTNRSLLSNGGRILTINPTSALGYSSSYYVVMTNGYVTANGNNFSGINTVGSAVSYRFTTRPVVLGDAFGGGTLICQAAGTRWIVAPAASASGGNWYNRNNGATSAQTYTGCTGWFIPSSAQFQNPGAVCAAYWDGAPTPGQYWSNTERDGGTAWAVPIPGGGESPADKGDTKSMRAFRTVSY